MTHSKRTQKRPHETDEENDRKRRQLRLNGNQYGQDQDQALAEVAVEGVALNAIAAAQWTKSVDLDHTAAFVAQLEQAKRVRSGDMGDLEMLLTAQAGTLNALFVQLARTTSGTTNLDHLERLTRMMFRAQSQCRATVEAIAFVKNPGSAVFAKQANIAHGPQQVNNGVSAPVSESERHAGAGTTVPARARKVGSRKTELLPPPAQRVCSPRRLSAVETPGAHAAVGSRNPDTQS